VGDTYTEVVELIQDQGCTPDLIPLAVGERTQHIGVAGRSIAA
jgi:hypothetical protein